METSKSLMSAFSGIYEKMRKGQLKTLIPLLCIFRLSGKPMNLRLHYQLAPMYNTVQPPQSIYMFARQLGKSNAICSSAGLRSGLIPFYHVLMVQPRSDQIQRLNTSVFKPLISSSPMQRLLLSNMELAKMAMKTFTNGSILYMDSVWQSGDKIRGVCNIATVFVDETQDVEYEVLPIIDETMSANLFWGFTIYTGTPKTTDTTMGLLWARSSQSEWVIPCSHCNHYNIPNPDHDLLKMIGTRGAICAKCGGAVSPADGGYVAAYPDRARSFPGYHVSQTIHPLHLFNQNKWSKLLHKVNTYPQLALYNEVFGWPYDLSVSPLTLGDLLNSCHAIHAKTPADLESVLLDYRWIAVGVDWHGGGLLSESFTALSVVGLRKDGDVLDVLYGERLPKLWSPAQEADYIKDWVNGVGADCFAFDNGGAGFLRLEMMKQRGLLNRRDLIVVPFNYVRPHSGDIVTFNAAKREADMSYYTLDKSRSLAVCSQSIKDARLRLPPFARDDESACQRDWLALREDPRQSLGGEVVILIIKKPGVPDDFAHATNFAASAIWDHYGAYPPLGRKYDPTVLEYDEENNRILPEDVFGPRGSFDRFQAEVEARDAVIQPNDMF